LVEVGCWVGGEVEVNALCDGAVERFEVGHWDVVDLKGPGEDGGQEFDEGGEGGGVEEGLVGGAGVGPFWEVSVPVLSLSRRQGGLLRHEALGQRWCKALNDRCTESHSRMEKKYCGQTHRI
jgi:hypothetical protein